MSEVPPRGGVTNSTRERQGAHQLAASLPANLESLQLTCNAIGASDDGEADFGRSGRFRVKGVPVGWVGVGWGWGG